MENRPGVQQEMGRATDLIKKRGRAYFTNGGKYVSVHVFSKYLRDVQVLCDLFGGGYYQHGVGWMWMLGSAREQLKLLHSLGGDIPEALQPLKERFK